MPKQRITYVRCDTRIEGNVAYYLLPPEGKFFPTNEVIVSILKRTRAGLTLHVCERYPDRGASLAEREVLYVFSDTPSALAKNASPERKAKGRLFLRVLARACRAKRDHLVFERLIHPVPVGKIVKGRRSP